MKKLFYIVLVIVILMVVARFVQQNKASEPMVNGEEIVAVEEAQIPAGEDVVAPAQEAAVEAEAIIANDGEIVEEGILEVEEVNPESTQDQDETIVKE